MKVITKLSTHVNLKKSSDAIFPKKPYNLRIENLLRF